MVTVLVPTSISVFVSACVVLLVSSSVSVSVSVILVPSSSSVSDVLSGVVSFLVEVLVVLLTS